jgi:MFS family permease
MILSFLSNAQHARARSLSAAILCAGLAGCGFGLLMPLVALNLETMTGSGALVGYNAAAAALSTIIMAPFVPSLLKRFPARAVIISSAILVGIGILLFPLFPIVWLWFVMRFAIGMPVTIIFVASETWINQLAKPESRASLLAVYASVLSAGFGSGGILLAILGTEGLAPWIAGALIFLIGAIPILFLRGPDIVPPEQGESGYGAMFAAAMLAPAAIFAGLVFGATENSVFALFPVYADRIGFSTGTIGGLMAVAALGGIILQFPLGKLADKIGRLRTLRLTALISTLLAIALALSGNEVLIIGTLIFLFVGLATGFYTLGLALMGERVAASALASANAAFIFIYGLGSLFGPVGAGYAMDLHNPYGLVWALAAFCGVYLLLSFIEKDTSKH